MSTKYSRASSKLMDIIAQAKIYHLHFNKMLEMARAVYDSKDYAGINGYDRAYLRGRWDGGIEELYHHHLVWKVSIDGQLTHGKDVPDGRWNECDPEGGRFVYRDDESRIFYP